MDELNGALLGYFTLTFKEISLDKSISKSLRKELDGFSKNSEQVRAYLIAQLGKNFSIANNPLRLASILEDHLYPVLAKAQKMVGGRVILLECENTQPLIRHYESTGFKLLQSPRLAQMFRGI